MSLIGQAINVLYWSDHCDPHDIWNKQATLLGKALFTLCLSPTYGVCTGEILGTLARNIHRDPFTNWLPKKCPVLSTE